MKLKLTVSLFFFLTICTFSIGQTTIANDFYQVNKGNGKGIKFWSNTDFYKIHMGNTANNKYGPVSDYSIKMNMSNHTGRGWVWGAYNKKPIAALNTEGNFQLAGNMTVMENMTVTERMVIKANSDATPTTGSGGLEIGGALRIDGNEIITNTNKHLYINQDNNGDVIFDANTLRVDASADRVGIGIWNPGSKLTVKSAQNESGIEANSPHGRSYFPYSNGWSYLSGKGIVLRTTNNVARLKVESDGDIVIGDITKRPAGYKLFVENGILAEKLRVAVHDLDDWADYVFEEDYDMMSIAKLDEYISENKHLPNVPSAEEVVKNGMDVAEMDAKLLEKIEEAYLYIIDLQKQIDILKSNQNK